MIYDDVQTGAIQGNVPSAQSSIQGYNYPYNSWVQYYPWYVSPQIDYDLLAQKIADKLLGTDEKEKTRKKLLDYIEELKKKI